MTRFPVEDVVPHGPHLEEFLNTMPLMLAIIDYDGNLLYVNKPYVDFVQIPEETLLKTTMLDIVTTAPEFSPERRLGLIRRTLDTREVIRAEIPILHRALNEEKMVRVKMAPHPSEDFIFFFLTDITDETKVAEHEELQSAILNTASEGIVVICDGGVINSANPAAEQMFGYDDDALEGVPVAELVTEDELVQQLCSASPDEKYELHTEGRCTDGRVFPIDISVGCFQSGGRKYFAATIRDATERVKYETMMHASKRELAEDLSRSNRALDRIFNLSGDVLGVFGFDGTVHSISPSVETLIGIAPEEFKSRKFGESTYYADRPTALAIFERAKQGESFRGFESRVVNEATEDVRWVSWNIQPVVEDEIIIVGGRDVTEQKQATAELHQKQKMEAIGQLTGGVAHDFNNLLGAMLGSLDLMQRRLTKGDVEGLERYIEAAHQAGDRATQLTQRLLAFARRQPLVPVPVNVNDLVASIEELVHRSIGPTMTIESKLEADPWYTVCDPHQLESSLINLAVNARDAMDGVGKVVIATKNISAKSACAHRLPAGDYVLLSVKDFGSGMSEEVQAKAFEPFFTTKKAGQGTGLGLSMLHGFVSQSGGHVRIKSIPGKGTTVNMFLPRHTEEVVVVEASTLEDKHVFQGNSSKTILVVDDEPLVRAVLVETMEECGFTTLSAASGKEALKFIMDPKQEIDLLLTDVGMPEMNGRELANHARLERPGLKTLFITGYAPDATKRGFLEEDMDMMTKPFKVDEVASRVMGMVGEVSEELVPG